MRTKSGSVHNTHAGFTVIEVVIAVAIVGILAAIAYPSYRESVFRARRADGKNALLNAQMAQEQFRANCPVYANDIGAPPSGTDACNPGAGATSYLNLSNTSSDRHYRLAITAGDATSYGITATPEPGGKQDGDSCGTFAVNQDGEDTSGTNASAECWDRSRHGS